MIVVAGEYLFDLIRQRDTSSKSFLWKGYAGGSPYNCAIALGRLEVDVQFASVLSDDEMGDQLAQHLQDAGVGLTFQDRVLEPTPLAMVSQNQLGVIEYRFHFHNTAYHALLSYDGLQHLPDKTTVLHLGSLALMDARSANYWLPIVRVLRERGTLISFDPNVRGLLIDDLSTYRQRFEDFLPLCDLIKISHEDIEYLYEGVSVQETFHRLRKGYDLSLAILTLGEGGSFGITSQGISAEVPVSKEEQSGDTIGAGDCFQAGLLCQLREKGVLKRERLPQLGKEDLHSALTFASVTSGLNCAQKGCVPPSREMVKAKLAKMDGFSSVV